jgi:glutaredoxin
MNISWLKRVLTIIRETKIFAVLFSCLVILFTGSSLATTLYKWVDADGKISYQDRPPPKNAKILEEREINVPEIVVPRIVGVPVVVYTVDKCERCDEVIAWLTNRGVPIEQRPLQEDREAQRLILDLSNGLTVPTLFIDDNFVTDTSEESMLKALRDAQYTLVLPETNTTTTADADSDESDTESDINQEAFKDPTGDDSTAQTPNLGVQE